MHFNFTETSLANLECHTKSHDLVMNYDMQPTSSGHTSSGHSHRRANHMMQLTHT